MRLNRLTSSTQFEVNDRDLWGALALPKIRLNPWFSVSAFAFVLFSVLIPISTAFASNRPPALLPEPTRMPAVSDPELNQAWHLRQIRALEAWRVADALNAPGVRVAIVDSGINYNHPDLRSNLVRDAKRPTSLSDPKEQNGFLLLSQAFATPRTERVGWDYVRGSDLPYDRSGHGTFLAGLVAAGRDNGVGAAGVCPSCKLVTARFLNYEGLGDTEDAILGIYYAVQNGARVINISFSGEGYDSDLKRAIEYAGEHDVLVVTSASNDAENLDRADTYPAKFNLPNLITVGASTRTDGIWEGSNWGRKSVHLAAPGEKLFSTWENTWADDGDGTSVSAAVLTGVAGLVRSVNPTLTALEVKSVLMNTARATDAWVEKSVTSGVVDALAAVECARAPTAGCVSRSPRSSARK